MVRTATARAEPAAVAMSAAALEAELVDARRDAAEAVAAVAEQEKAYQVGLLKLDERQLAAILERKAAAQITADRGAAIVAALEERLGIVQQSEADAERRAHRVAARRLAEEKTAAAVRILRTDYAQAVETILGVLEAVAVAQRAVDAANDAAGEDDDPLEPAEGLRFGPALPREVASEETVSLWCDQDTGEPISEAQQSAVKSETGTTGVLVHGDAAAHLRYRQIVNRTLCIRRSFRRREILEEVRPARRRTLAGELRLPALLPGGLAWPGSDGALSPNAVLTMLERARASAAKPPEPRGVEIELVPLTPWRGAA